MKIAIILALAAGLASSQTAPNDRAPNDQIWKTATEFPNVDLSGFSADQKQALLKLLREENCTCECGMKMAECRLKDPKCSFSRSSVTAAVKALHDGKSIDSVRKVALSETKLKLLGDPIKIRTEGSPSRGPAGAPVTLVEFSDFQCPYCSKAAADLAQVVKQFPSDVRLVYKQYPLAEIHSQATLASRASLAAQAQGKFWEMHDKMFANNRDLSKENIAKWAREIGLDMARFDADLDSKELQKTVERDVAEGDEAGVLGTPTIFVNGKHYSGSLDPHPLAEVIKGELKK